MHKKGQLGIKHEDKHEENTNGADGSRSHKMDRMDMDDTMKSGKLLDTPERMASTHGFYSSFSSGRHHHYYC